MEIRELGRKPHTVIIDGQLVGATNVVMTEVRERPAPTPQANHPITNRHRKVGRNDPCPCGSGKKFKKCHFLLGVHLVEKKT